MKRGLLPEPKRCLPWLLFLLLAGSQAAHAADLPPGEGEPLLQYFSSREYHANTQCLCAVQDARGVMYVGNLGVVLEYDGSTWRRIAVGQSSPVLGLGYEAATDTVFVGGQNELGYLKTLPGGARTFVSLLDQLPADARDVGTVYGVHATPDGVFFVGTSRVLRWREGRFKTWPLATTRRLWSDRVNGHLYVFSRDIGLLRLEQEAFVPASNDPLFNNSAVHSILADADGALLVGTARDGLFTLRDGTVRPLDTECGAFLKEKGIYQMRRLRDGSLAVATNTGGLLILDPAGHFRNRLDETTGLHGNTVWNLFEDREGGLWVGLQSGIIRAEFDSPWSVLRAGAGDDLANTFCADYCSGTLFLGSYSGFYRVVPANPSGAVGTHLERVPGIAETVMSLANVQNGLLTVVTGKVALLGADGRLTPVSTGIVNARYLCGSRVHPGQMFVSDDTGHVYALRLDPSSGQWVNDGIVAATGVPGDVILTESVQGDLWLGTKEHGLFLARLVPGGPAAITSFLDRPGPLRGERYVVNYEDGGPMIFDTLKSLCQPDQSGQNVRPLTEFGPRFNDGSLRCENLLSYDAQSLWVVAKNANDPTGDQVCGQAVIGRNGRPPTFQPLPHKVAEVLGEVRAYLPVAIRSNPADTLLLAGATGNGVVRLDLRRWEAQGVPAPFATLIRRAVVAGHPSPGQEPEPIPPDPLPYGRNSVHFEFAASTFAFGAAPKFQTRLVNFGSGDWSDFSDRASVDYLNLPEGRYTFEARARDADGLLGSVASLPFRILPPWQRTPWAYTLYALTMAAGLAAFIRWRGRQLRRRNAALETLVDARTSELRGRETELVRARDDAEAASRAKSAFLANMSHELRTPLNAVLGYAQLLLKQPDLTARSRERITVICQSGSHLLSLVNEVLDLSKVEAGKLTLSPFDFSLGQLLDEVGAAFRPRLAEKRLTFAETRAPGLPATVHTDPSRLRQVLFNLMSNATKFTHRGGVTLQVFLTDDKRVRFEVADTGVGIEPKDQRDIFVAFHQAGESRLASQGTGLGLTISQRLVELLGGRIELESAPGRGSRFWFELPLHEIESSDGSISHAVRDPALGKVTGYEGSTRRLLLVDDLIENRRVLRDFLQPLGFEIEEATDGTACLAACARQMPNAVLLDLRLGTPDGFEVARALRARLDGAPLAIIAISASVFESDRQQALDAGCDDFLPKPFEESQLLGVLGRVLGLRWAREIPAEIVPSADGEKSLPPDETDALLELSLRGDAASIRRRLDALRASEPPAGTLETLRQLDALVAAFDMEGIHELLLKLRSQNGN